MTEPRYQIHEDDFGCYEVHEPGADAPITIQDTLEEAVAWVKRMEPKPPPSGLLADL